MAPSGRSNGATTTDSSSALRRTRSTVELKRDVLSLVRRTRSALSSDSDDTRLEAHYQRFHEACSAWVATIFGSCSTSADATNTSSSHHEQQMQRRSQQQRQKNQAMCEQLTELTQLAAHQQRNCGENRELVGVVVRSIGATAQIRTQRRKRKLPTASANVSAAGADTYGDIGRVVEFVGVWLLHSSGLSRLEDVILGVVSGGVAEKWEWLTASVHYLLSHKAQHLHLALPAAEHSAAAVLTTTTHGVVESVIQYIIRLAFTDSENTTTDHSRHGSYTSSHASEQAATQILEELCFFTCPGFSIPSLRLVTQLLSKRALLDDHLHDRKSTHGIESISNASNNFGRLVVARDHVVAFLQPQVAKLASPYSLVQAAYTHDELEEIFAAYQSCLSTSTFVQIVRQFIYEASGGSSNNDISPDAAMSGEPRSVVCDALYQLILSVACKRSDFVDQVLTLAHDLASKGIQGMNGFFLRHSLELVAAVSNGANTKKKTTLAESATATRSNAAVDTYRDWVRDHFAAGQDTNAGSKATTTADDSRSTATAPAPTLSLRCLKQRKTCGLVTSKRQIQFLCAFLLEFDRREQQSGRRKTGDGNPTCSQYPVAKSDHVAAHLSVMKTHQSQFPSGGLIMDFCSQTRSRYLELLKIEQAATAAANAVEAANTNGQQTGKKQQMQSSLHSAKVRNIVRESIQLYRDTKKLSPQLRQWKMFQPQLWKQGLIPCCLDIDFDNLQGAEMSRDGDAGGSDRSAAESRLLEHVAFVHALAKSGLVSVQEYSQFLTFAEDWLERRQKRRKLKKAPHKRQRHEGDGEGFGPALVRLQQEINGERSAKLWRQRNCVSQETTTKLRQALESTLMSLYDAERSRNEMIVSTKQMQSLWEDGCMRVLELFSLDEVDAFFAYLVPVLERSTSSSQKDTTDATLSTASQPQDKEDATTPGVSIANFFVSRVSWTEPIDESFLYEVSCLAAVVGSILGKNGGESQSSGVHPDLVNLIQRIDEKIVAGVEAPGAKVLSHDQLLRRSLFYATMLRAAALLSPDKQQDRRQDQAHIVKALLHCESLDPRIRDFISWIGYRSIVDLDSSQRSPTRDRQAVPRVLCEEARVQPLQFLLGNLCAVSQMRWYKETFPLEKISKKQLQKLITLEFRFGFKLFGGASTSTSDSLLLPPSATTISDAGDLREWLQIELDVIADLGGFRIASVEDVSKWIIAEILLQITSLSSSGDNLEVSSADNAVALMLLVLNDLMHKLNFQDIGAAKSKNSFQAGVNRGLSSGSHDRIFAFFVTSAAKLIRENGQVFPVDLRLQHHGFEVLEICARHHIDCRFSKELVSTDGGGTLLELLSYIGDHFESRFSWSLLQALLFYLVELTSSDQEVSHPTAIRIRDIPAAIVIRCAMEYSQLRTVLECRRISKNESGSGKQDAVMKHLNWVHQFSQRVIQGDDDSVSSRDHESKDREASPFDRMEMFPSEVDKTKYQIQIVKYLFRWKLVQVPDLTTQSHLVSPFYRVAAVRILQAFGASPKSDSSIHNDVRVMDGHNNHMLLELATCFVNEWLQSAFVKEEKGSDEMPRQVDFHFQLFLVHAVAELCQRSAQVSKTLLHSWRKSRPSMVDGSALFIVLLAISLSSGGDTHVEQFEQVLRSNSSLWLNEFPKIALHVHSMSLLTSDPDGEDTSSVVKLTKVIANAQSFADCLELVMIKALNHGIANQVGVLDAELPLHIRQVWPGLSHIVSQLHVLTLDNDDENPSEF